MTLRINQVQLSGNAGKDAILQYLASGTPKCEFSLAVNNGWMKEGVWQDATEWANIVCFGDVAERITPLVTKGKGVYVQGKLQTRSWDGTDGTKHYRTEIIANTVQLLDKAPAQEQQGSPRKQAPAKPQKQAADDLPWE